MILSNKNGPPLAASCHQYLIYSSTHHVPVHDFGYDPCMRIEKQFSAQLIHQSSSIGYKPPVEAVVCCSNAITSHARLSTPPASNPFTEPATPRLYRLHLESEPVR